MLRETQAELAVVTDLKGTLSGQLDRIEQYRSDLAERDKVARDRLKRIELLETALRILKKIDKQTCVRVTQALQQAEDSGS